MELELGLALPHVHLPIKYLDLNICSFEAKESGFGCGLEFKNKHKEKKRTFVQAFDNECIVSENKTPSLLVWDGQPNDGRDDGKEGKRRTSDNIVAGKNEEEDQIVGWPPIKSWRKKLLHSHHHHHQINNQAGIIYGRGGTGGVIKNSIYVKVKMEGVAIGRKIDLLLFNSYQALITTLLNMFAKYRENDKDKNETCSYILSYLDKDGDWLLAGDVPWQIFIETAQRIEISKQSST